MCWRSYKYNILAHILEVKYSNIKVQVVLVWNMGISGWSIAIKGKFSTYFVFPVIELVSGTSD